MINLSTNKKLDIILANTNKALAKVINDIPPNELKKLDITTQNKDLKSIINSMFEQTSKSSSTDKALLELLKNNPTLKNLSDISTNIKELLNAIKSDKNPLPIEKTLKNFLLDMKDLSEPALKQKLLDSGIFLESKLKNVQNPQLELKNTLKELLPILKNSNIFNAKTLLEDIKNLLQNQTLKDSSNTTLTKPQNENMKALEQLSKNIQNIVEKLQIHLNKSDIINTKEFALSLEKTIHQTSPKLLEMSDFKLSNLQESLSNLTTQLQQSQIPQTKGIFDTLNKILQLLDTKIPLEQFIDKKLPQDIRNIVDNLKDIIKNSDPIFSKESLKTIEKLSTFDTPQKLSTNHNIKEIISNDLKAVLLKAGDELSQSSHPNQNEIIKHIDKLALAIDYQQLLSHLSNSSAIYLPFSWETLEGGNLNIKKDKNDKFYCDIELKLKEYGELTLKLVLYDKNQLNLHIYSDDVKFKELVKEHIPSLRSALINTQITPREIRLFKKTKEGIASKYNIENTPIDMGFEVKV